MTRNSKEYNRQYYQENKEKFKEYRKKVREQQRIYMRDWRERNREKIKKYNRIYSKEYRKQEKEKTRSRNYYLKNKQKISEKKLKLRHELEKILGKKCQICSRECKNIIYHEIHGKLHPTTSKYVFEHKEDFIPLCWTCHSSLHWIKLFKTEFLRWLENV